MQEVGISCSSLDVGSGKGRLDLSSLLQFNAVFVACCCGTQGETSSWMGWNRLDIKKLALWAGLSLDGHGEGQLCPQSQRLVATVGRCGHMPLLGMRITV